MYRGSESKPGSIGVTENDPGDALNDTSDCDKLVCNMESDLEVDDKETDNDPVVMIPITTDDDEDEPAVLNFAWPNSHPDGRKFAETNGPKEVTNDTYNHVRPEDNLEEFKAPELEI